MSYLSFCPLFYALAVYPVKLFPLPIKPKSHQIDKSYKRKVKDVTVKTDVIALATIESATGLHFLV